MDQSIASEYDFKTPNQDSNQYPAETAASSYSNHHTLYQDTAAAPLNISNDSTGCPRNISNDSSLNCQQRKVTGYQ